MRSFIMEKVEKDNRYTYDEVKVFLKYYNLSSKDYKKLLKYKFPEKDIKYSGVYIRSIIEEFGDKRYGSSEALRMINNAFKGFENKVVRKKDLDIPICNIYGDRKIYRKRDIETYIRENKIISIQALTERDDFKELNVSARIIRKLIIDLKLLGFISNEQNLDLGEIFYKDLGKVKRVIIEQKGLNNEK